MKEIKILLTPDSAQPSNLKAYDQAFTEAVELCIASAFLMDWSDARPLGPQCKRLRFYVGRDFGLSRKKAMLDVLRWKPTGSSFLFKAVSGKGMLGGFHPKLVFWKTAEGKCRCVLGSANLSKAAFGNNYEANVLFPISDAQFDLLASWLAKAPSVRITEDWIKHHYTEANIPKLQKSAGAHNSLSPINYIFKAGQKYSKLVNDRRKRQAAFKTIEGSVRAQVIACAKGKTTNSKFWKWFWQIWGAKTAKQWRFQGKGVQISGKSADWREACQALSEVLKAAPRSHVDELDDLVIEQMDRLSKSHNPVRKAWLSEMLCHFFPDLYPVENDPVRRWLKKVRYRGSRGLSWGNRYVELAGQLRGVVASRPSGARNLAELDTLIWAHAPAPKHRSKKVEAKTAGLPKSMGATA